jgi:hypothetical protein
LSGSAAFWAAFRCGSLRGVCLRSSLRSFSGFVLVCYFPSFESACRLARALAARLPGPARPKIRRAVSRSGLPVWAVSVPVELPALGLSVFGSYPVRGGVVPAAHLARLLS